MNLDDDFIKFLRYAAHQVETTGVGAVCMITNNIFLSGVTHRQLRRHLIETFPRQWVADLHGDSRYGEVAPPGSANENVFDIQQGVCILLLSKDINAAHRTTRHAHVWGTRGEKFAALAAQASIDHADLQPEPPYYYLQPSALQATDPYHSWPLLTEWMPVFSNGIETHKDALTLHFSRAELKAAIEKLLALPVEEARVELSVGNDGRDWRLADAVKSLRALIKAGRPVVTITYRPFDERYTYLNAESGGFIAYPRWDVMASLTEIDGNIGLVSARLMARGGGWDSCFVTRHPTEKKTGDSTRSSTLFPLLVKAGDSLSLGEKSRVNLSARFLKDAEALMTGETYERSAPDVVFDYIYAVLHSPSYRLQYLENLKGDFPRIPFPSKASLLIELARCGRKLRCLHLMDPAAPSEAGASYTGPANPEVEKIIYADSSVWLDKRRTRGFGNVPADIWEFRIGGYQICEKWLKDRKGRTLSKDEIAHYRAVVGAIAETLRVMTEVDAVVEEHGGWPGAFVTKASSS